MPGSRKRAARGRRQAHRAVYCPDVEEADVAAVAHVIQLAVAPVFLLTGVAALLGVLTNRLSRIIDRARRLEGWLPDAEAPRAQALHGELALLAERARLVNWAISSCTSCALLICIVIAALFIGTFLSADVSTLVAGLFVLAMLALVGGLLTFLREIYLATRNLRIGPR